MVTLYVVLFLTLIALSSAGSHYLEYCYEKMIIDELHVGRKTMIIHLENKNSILPVGIRVRVTKVYNGAYLVSALLPKSARTLSEATFATPGEMDFDPRYVIGSIRVTFAPGVPSDNNFRQDRKPRVRIQVFGCYDPN